MLRAVAAERAEFAMATRRLEMNVEQLQAKTTSQLAKLGKQTETINRLKAELAAAVDTIAALQAQEKSLQEQLLSTAEELGLKNTALEEAERKLAERKAELAKFSADLNERTIWADSQRVEIVARETQLAALRDRVDDLERDVKQAEERFQQARNDAEKANKALAEEREERARVEREMDTLSQETEATWAKQREENAVIRECINDVAAEVARLTMALEGAGSPMETILAADEIGRAAASLAKRPGFACVARGDASRRPGVPCRGSGESGRPGDYETPRERAKDFHRRGDLRRFFQDHVRGGDGTCRPGQPDTQV